MDVNQPRPRPSLGSLSVLLLTLALAGCGGGSGGGGGTGPPPNPVPAITSISPTSGTAGSGPLTLTVAGTNFISTSKVRWNGSERTTIFSGSTKLTAAITVADTAAAGSAQVTVSNPAPGGGVSNPEPFALTNGVPTVTGLSPSPVLAGGPAFTLTVTGASFASGSQALWNGSGRPTTFVSSTQLTAMISASDIAAASNVQITVSNPPPGGGTSAAFALPIQQPGPLAVTTTRLPDSAAAKSYYFIVYSSGGIPPVSWSLSSGSLPDGLSFGPSTALISGTINPSAVGTTFTLQVTDSAVTPHGATQTLSINVLSGPLGRNDVCTAGTTAGTTAISNGRLRASISPYGDIDVYSFQGTAGAQVTAETFAQRLTINGSRSWLDTVLELLDSSCNPLAVNDDLSDNPHIQDSLIGNFSLPYTGTYFLRVRDFRSDGRPDLIYDLSLMGAN